MGELIIMKRREAKELGLSKYFTGKPCANGHIAERYIGGHCVLCMSDIMKKQHDKDRAKVRDRNISYNKKNRLAINKYNRERYAKKKLERGNN